MCLSRVCERAPVVTANSLRSRASVHFMLVAHVWPCVCVALVKMCHQSENNAIICIPTPQPRPALTFSPSSARSETVNCLGIRTMSDKQSEHHCVSHVGSGPNDRRVIVVKRSAVTTISNSITLDQTRICIKSTECARNGRCLCRCAMTVNVGFDAHQITYRPTLMKNPATVRRCGSNPTMFALSNDADCFSKS